MNAVRHPAHKALKFLREHLQSQEPFGKQDLMDATGWHKPGTFNTYWSKQLKPFVVDVGVSVSTLSDGPSVTQIDGRGGWSERLR